MPAAAVVAAAAAEAAAAAAAAADRKVQAIHKLTRKCASGGSSRCPTFQVPRPSNAEP